LFDILRFEEYITQSKVLDHVRLLSPEQMQEQTPEFYEAYFDHLLSVDVPTAAQSIALEINNVTNLTETIPGINLEDTASIRLTEKVILSRQPGSKGVWYSPYVQEPDAPRDTPKPGTRKGVFGIIYGPKIREVAKSLGVETDAAYCDSSVSVESADSWKVTINHQFFDEQGSFAAVQAVGNQDIFIAITQPPLDIAESFGMEKPEIKEVWKSIGKLMDELNTLA